MGPAEEEAAPAQGERPTAQFDERPRSLFERIGIKVIRRDLTNPDGETARELVEEAIIQGYHTPEAVLARIREESPVAVTHLKIDLSRQRLYLMNRNDHVLGEYKVSTGVPGYPTPTGRFSVVNKAPHAYSRRYEADMYHWMGLDRRGDVGMHGLKGSAYERKLGRRASHGCIRLSREDARYLYSIIPLGMRVDIVTRIEPLVFYEPISDQDLRALVSQLLGTDYRPLVAF